MQIAIVFLLITVVLGLCWVLWLSLAISSFPLGDSPARFLVPYVRDLAIFITNLLALVTMNLRKGIARILGIMAFAAIGTQTAIYLGTMLRVSAITGDLNLPITIVLSLTSLGAILLLGIFIFSKDIFVYFLRLD